MNVFQSQWWHADYFHRFCTRRAIRDERRREGTQLKQQNLRYLAVK